MADYTQPPAYNAFPQPQVAPHWDAPSYPPPQTSTPPRSRTETSGTPQAASSGIQLARDADFLIQSFLPPSVLPVAQHGHSGLPLPFCTPQIAVSFDSPFARGYNPTLHSSVDISQNELLAFIDGLNLAMTASPPLRVLSISASLISVAGMVIGFIPYHWAMIAGTVMQTAAQTGMHILSKTLTDRYMRAANLRLFKPKGLSVRLCTSAAMQHLVMRTGNGAGPSTMDKIGRGVGTVLLHAPIPFSSRVVRAIADKPPKVHASISNVGDGQKMPLATQRRLASLEGYSLPLQLDVPPPAKAQNAMDKMGQWGVQFDSWRTGRQQTKIEQKRRELARVESQLQRMGLGPPPHMGADWYEMGRRERKRERKRQRKQLRREDKLLYREDKQLRKAAKRSRRRERRGAGLIGSLIGPKETKLERRVANADLVEHWESDKVLWLVIMNAEMDREIEGIERAESMDDEERVDAKTWQAEIIKERDALEEDSDSDSDSSDSDDEEPQHGHFGGDQKLK
ncbi:hypothetical protein C8R47DRAFT_993200 [Mycena vitilis]|nr:hypothetical protein C8R47DRAFT_993200 [Mycena vitilis]